MIVYCQCRLATFPNVKKEATSLTGKLIQPILNLLDEDGAESVWVSITGCVTVAWFLIPEFLSI